MDVTNVFDYRGRADLPLGIRNNNPGNIRPGDSWVGEAGVNKGFVVFRELPFGIRALAIDLVNKHLKGYNTIRKVITRYAPESENNTEAYIKAVSDSMNLGPDHIYDLTKEHIQGFVMAICLHENGPIAKQFVSPLLIADCMTLMPLKLYQKLK